MPPAAAPLDLASSSAAAFIAGGRQELADKELLNPVVAREFAILFEDDAFMAINKPAGVAVHGGSGVSFGVIEQIRKARPQAKFLELVHRLDRETSGILLIAKKSDLYFPEINEYLKYFFL